MGKVQLKHARALSRVLTVSTPLAEFLVRSGVSCFPNRSQRQNRSVSNSKKEWSIDLTGPPFKVPLANGYVSQGPVMTMT